jgi:hypothetical protein
LLDVDVLHLKHVFPENEKDVDWLPHAGLKGWIVVTVDHAIRTKTAEYEAMKRNQVTVLFMTRSFLKRTQWPQAQWLISKWPKIDEQARKLRPGTIVEVNDNGKLVPFI